MDLGGQVGKDGKELGWSATAMKSSLKTVGRLLNKFPKSILERGITLGKLLGDNVGKVALSSEELSTKIEGCTSFLRNLETLKKAYGVL